MIIKRPGEATEDGAAAQDTEERVPVNKMDREQRALLVEEALETKDQDISRLLRKLQERKARCTRQRLRGSALEAKHCSRSQALPCSSAHAACCL